MTTALNPTAIALDPQAIATALETDAVARRIMAKDKFPVKGQRVGVRLNLNVLKTTGVAVQTLHAATNRHGYTKNKGFYNGEAIGPRSHRLGPASQDAHGERGRAIRRSTCAHSPG